MYSCRCIQVEEVLEDGSGPRSAGDRLRRGLAGGRLLASEELLGHVVGAEGLLLVGQEPGQHLRHRHSSQLPARVNYSLFLKKKINL